MTASPIRVRLVTTWGTSCGIAEHSAMLKRAVEAADPGIEITPDATVLDPLMLLHDGREIIHLNYHAGLHSRWTRDHIFSVRASGQPVLVTYHDTGVPNSDQCKAIIDAADAAVVHEPFDDLPEGKTYYWRMGVCDARPAAMLAWSAYRPHLGTVGHDFPWKCWGELAKVTAANGWGLVICTPAITEARRAELEAINPHTEFHVGLQEGTVIRTLAACDATAFTNVCHNAGQSGAILLGIAARKPVIALRTCRQYRALAQDDLASLTIAWVEDFEGVSHLLRFGMTCGRLDTGIVALAEQESWRHLGAKYAALYRTLATGGR